MVNIHNLSPGSTIDVETKSRHYLLECLGGSSVRISGHPDYCPTPVPAHVQGSISREDGLELGLIQVGSRLLIFLDGNRPFTTSRVLSVRVHQPGTVQSPASSSIH
jgi:hypothetical protein